MTDDLETRLGGWLHETGHVDAAAVERLAASIDELPTRPRAIEPLRRSVRSLPRVAVAAAVVVAVALAAVTLGQLPRNGAPPLRPTPPDPAAFTGDPRLARCGVTGPGEAIFAFEMAHAADFPRHFPAAGRAPELEVSDPAFVVVYRGFSPLGGGGGAGAPPAGQTWPPRTPRPGFHDVCVLVGADRATAELNVYQDVDIAGFRVDLPASSGAPPTPVPSSPAATAPVETPRSTQRPRGSFAGGALVSPTDGWAFTDGDMVTTRDGGRTWQATAFPKDGSLRFFGASFLDRDHGWAVRETVPEDASAVPLQVRVERTADGGATWDVTALPPIRTTTHDVAIASPVLSFVDARLGYLLLSVDGPGGGWDLLYATVDGGRTWTARPSPPARVRWIRFVDRLDGWAAGGGAGTLYRTDDGGITWQRQELPQVAGIRPADLELTTGPSTAGGSLLVLYAPLAGDGEGGVFLTSADRGATWAFAARTPKASAQAAAILDDRTWLVGGGPELLVTHDAGATWDPVGTDLPGPVSRFDVVDSSTASAVAQENGCGGGADCFVPFVLYVTGDGGSTWRAATP